MRAYVLIEAAIGKVSQVAQKVRALPGVVAADAVAGPYDVIAVVEGDSAERIGQLVLERIHSIEGVNYTMTCVVVTE
ncbi:MAG: Lrp/AsnC family transcriptional regulator [Chloroflexia bacterium]